MPVDHSPRLLHGPPAGSQVPQRRTGIPVFPQAPAAPLEEPRPGSVQHQQLEGGGFKLSVFGVGSILSHPGTCFEAMPGSPGACRWLCRYVCQPESPSLEEAAEGFRWGSRGHSLRWLGHGVTQIPAVADVASALARHPPFAAALLWPQLPAPSAAGAGPASQQGPRRNTRCFRGGQGLVNQRPARIPAARRQSLDTDFCSDLCIRGGGSGTAKPIPSFALIPRSHP